MKIYHHHHETYRYLGTTDAVSDPVVEDSYLVPRHATKIEPPVVENGYVAIFSKANQTWSVVEDIEGIWYTPLKQKVNIAGFTTDTSELTRTPPPSPSDFYYLVDKLWILDQVEQLASAKADKWKAIKKARAIDDNSNITWDTSVFQADERSLQKLITKTRIMGTSVPIITEVDWTLADNTTRPMELADINAVIAAIDKRASDNFDKSQALRVSIDAAVLLTDLDTINW